MSKHHPNQSHQGTRNGAKATAMKQPKATMQEGISELASSLKEEAAHDLDAAKEFVGETVEKVGEVIKDAQEAVVDAGQAVVTSVKRNPMPAALAGFGLVCAGAGVTWMMMSSKSSTSAGRKPDGTRRAQQAGAGNGSTPPDRSSISKATEAAGKKLEGVRRGISTRGRQLGKAAQQGLQDNPLAAGATLAAVGAAIGLAIPITRRENEWLGEGRDEIVDKAEELARNAITKVEKVTKAVTG